MNDGKHGARVAHFTAGDAELFVLSVPAQVSALPSHVTPAEREVLTLLFAGKTNEQIASARGVSTSTVVNQLARLFAKFNVGSRLELIAHLSAASKADAGVETAKDEPCRTS